MKFELDEILVYQDDGSFPSLNGLQCRVLGLDKHLGCKFLHVEFILYNGTPFEYSFGIKQFKKIKDKTKIKERPRKWQR